MEESVASNSDLLTHELGHQWWGNIVAPYIHNHMWLKEGGAEYTNTLFEEWKNGHDAMVEFIKDNQQFVLEECHIQDNGHHALSPMPDEEIYGRQVYKGASIHHNLRAYLGMICIETHAKLCCRVLGFLYGSRHVYFCVRGLF